MWPIPQSLGRRQTQWLAIAVVAASVAACGPGVVARPAAAITKAMNRCLPYQLPGTPGAGGGELMTMNDVGLYVGRVRDASGARHAAWWTHSGADPSRGWSLHVPETPATDSEFLDVNKSGLMSGTSADTGRGFVYDSNTGNFTWLPDFASGHQSWARRVNASGVVAGSAADASGASYAAIWRPPYAKAERVHLPDEGKQITRPDGSHAKGSSEIDGINDQGDVAGYTSLGTGPDDGNAQLRGYTKLASGQLTELAGHGQAYGFAINNAGLVVGASLPDPNGGFLPAYWQNGVEHDLTEPAGAVSGTGADVSQGGWVVGRIVVHDNARSFIWTGAGTIQLNEPLPGYDESESHGVSDALHQVVGSSTRSDGTRVPTVWQCPADFTTG
jgi:hypothetical protein